LLRRWKGSGKGTSWRLLNRKRGFELEELKLREWESGREEGEIGRVQKVIAREKTKKENEESEESWNGKRKAKGK
jgi:hypothetical protein